MSADDSSNSSPLPVGPVLDGHAHAFPDALAARAVKVLAEKAIHYPVQAWSDGTVRGLLASMDRAGIDKAILCSVATSRTQVRNITDWSVTIASERLIPFASIHPAYERIEEEVERIAATGVIRGIKLHPQYMGTPADDPRFIRIARAAAKAGLALTYHAGHDPAYDRTDIASPRRLRNVFEAAPGLKLQACHLGGWMQWEEVLELLAGLPIWLESSCSLSECPRGLLERLLEKHGPEYLMFGTDSPWNDQRRDLEQFRQLPLSNKAMGMALYDNGLRLAGLAAT